MPSGYTSTLPADVLLDVGVLTYDVGGVATKLGVTRGGLTFTPSVDMRNVEFDGKRSDIEGLDRVTKRGGSIAGTFIQIGATQLPIYEPGSASATANSITTITPKAASSVMASGDYLTNLTLTFQRNGGGTVSVVFAKALCVKWDVKGIDNSEAEVSCEFHARLAASVAATSTDASPYVIKVA